MKDPIYLLSIEEYKKYRNNIPNIDKWWWLRSPGFISDFAAGVGFGGFVISRGHGVNFSDDAVRPALNISNLEIDAKDDRFEYLGVEWVVLDKHMAISVKPIFYSCFDETSNNYDESTIRRKLLQWYSDRNNQKFIKRVKINRTGRKVEIPISSELRRCHSGNEIAGENGYKRIDVLDIEKYSEINWVRAEHNRLFAKDGVLYRFNNWTGDYPYTGIELEEIGTIKEVPVLRTTNDPRLNERIANLIKDTLDIFSVEIPKEFKDVEEFGNATGSIRKIREAVLSAIEAAGYAIEEVDE